MTPHLAFVLLRHIVRVWRAGQLRFRLETFGLYYPTPPYSAHWWQMSPDYARMLLGRLVPYARWVAEQEAIQRRGAIRRRRWTLMKRIGKQ